MKKYILTVLISMMAISVSCQKNKDNEFDKGSNIIFPELNESVVNDLELLGKLWGFLKYHHPQIGKGNYNWDYELFRMLPNYLKATDIQQRDKILLNWIKKIGKIPTCKTCKETPTDAYLKPNLLWVENSNMNANLKNKIQEIYLNKETYQGKLVVLVNENSQSQAEYTAMAFRAGKNTTIVGSTTAGADGNVSTIVLPGGLRTMISGIGVYYPDGTKTQRVGIVPDIWVEPTIDGIKNGKDEVLEKAIELIEQQ